MYYLFLSEMQDREMLTGHHVVRDVSCKNCDSMLGWFYEFASEESQRLVVQKFKNDAWYSNLPLIPQGLVMNNYRYRVPLVIYFNHCFEEQHPLVMVGQIYSHAFGTY